VLWNGVILVGLLIVAPIIDGDGRVYAYAVAILIGTVAQLLYLLPFLRGKGPFPISLGLGNRHIKRVLVLMLPVTLSLGLINVNASVDGIFATLVSEEAPRAIDAAFRLYILPQGVFSVAISTVLFPTISRLAARDDIDGLRSTVADGLRQIFFMLAPATAFLMVLSEPVVRLVFEHGAFDARSTELTSSALFFFTIGLAFNGASLLLIRAFFSLQRPWLPTGVAFLGLVLNALLDLAFYGPLGVGGIPLATSISSIVTFLALAELLRREIGGLEEDRVLQGIVRCAVASAVLALLAWTSWRVVDDALGRGLLAQMVSLGAALLAGGIAYLGAAQAFDLPELRLLARLTRPLR
jgi:putative peptidoglycan lipid II flippase